MTATNADHTSDADASARSQQSVLASQRAKDNGENDEGFIARMAKLWPMGNKESAQQWVGSIPILPGQKIDCMDSGMPHRPPKQNIASYHS